MVFFEYTKDGCVYKAITANGNYIELYFDDEGNLSDPEECLVCGLYSSVKEDINDYLVDDVPNLKCRITDYFETETKPSSTLAIEDLSFEELRKLYNDVSKRYVIVATAAFKDRIAKLVNDIESIKRDFPYCTACYSNPLENGKYNIFDQDWTAADFFWNPKDI